MSKYSKDIYLYQFLFIDGDKYDIKTSEYQLEIVRGLSNGMAKFGDEIINLSLVKRISKINS
jgi:hypothetical protein